MHFLTNDGSVSIVCLPTSSSCLRRLGISHVSLKKVQVATILHFCWEKYVFIRLLPGKSVWYHCVTVCHRL